MRNLIYTLDDLSCAKHILENNFIDQSLDQYGGTTPKHWVKWAKKVVKFYKAIYAYARQCTGTWSTRIALAWQWMWSVVAAKRQMMAEKYAPKQKVTGNMVCSQTAQAIRNENKSNLSKYEIEGRKFGIYIARAGRKGIFNT